MNIQIAAVLGWQGKIKLSQHMLMDKPKVCSPNQCISPQVAALF